HLVDGTQEDPAAAWRTIRAELEAYDPELAAKPEILALNKVDALDPETRAETVAALEAAAGVKPMLVSGVSGEGVRELLRSAFALVKARRADEAEAAREAEFGPAEAWRP